MTAQKKISEAEYFLNRLPIIPTENVTFEVSAFLTPACSVFAFSRTTE